MLNTSRRAGTADLSPLVEVLLPAHRPTRQGRAKAPDCRFDGRRMFNPRLPDDVEADVLQADGERLIPEPQFDLNRPVLAGPMDLSPASMLVVLADPSGSVLVEPFEAGQFPFRQVVLPIRTGQHSRSASCCADRRSVHPLRWGADESAG